MEETPFEIVRLWKHDERYQRRLYKRSDKEVAEVTSEVEKIVREVRNRGDFAIIDFTEKYDGIKLTPGDLKVTEEEFSRAFDRIRRRYMEAIREAANAIKKYHERQLPEGWMEEFESGVSAGQVLRPLESVGVYVPGGSAIYPSSALMSIIPAKVAGVDNVVVCTPPNSDGTINRPTLVAAEIAGADEVYRVGGAQAIAAMAYEGKTIPTVDKIVGPGSSHVAAAKKVVSSAVDIEFMAGPSEILILADSKADPSRVALDLVAQAEHDESASSVLVTTSEKLAESVVGKVNSLLEEIPRGRTAWNALLNHGKIILARSSKKALNFVNNFAPEHLELMVRDPEETLEEIENAGAIFLGPDSPASAGDFAVGPSHVLPTGGGAKIHDGLSVMDFIRMPSVQSLSKDGLKQVLNVVEELAEMEGLEAHARSVRDRLER